MKPATHLGHCQACGREQAVDPDKGNIVKHGYTVDWGYFNGVCRGARRKPLEIERTYADEIIVSLRTIADGHAKHVADLRSGAFVPERVKTHGRVYDEVTRKHVPVTIPWADAADYQRASTLSAAIWNAEQGERSHRQHAQQLEQLAAGVHGKPLPPFPRREKPAEIAIGASFKARGTHWTVKDFVSLGRRAWRGTHTHVKLLADDQTTKWILSKRQVREFLKKGG